MSSENILQTLPKPINSDINEFLKPLLQTKTGIVNVRAMKLLRKTQVLKFKNKNH